MTILSLILKRVTETDMRMVPLKAIGLPEWMLKQLAHEISLLDYVHPPTKPKCLNDGEMMLYGVRIYDSARVQVIDDAEPIRGL